MKAPTVSFLALCMSLSMQAPSSAGLARVPDVIHYSGAITEGGESDTDIQLELSFEGASVHGFYAYDKTGKVVVLEGDSLAVGRLNLKAFTNGTHVADIMLVRTVTSPEDQHAPVYSDYAAGTTHWVGYIFKKNGYRIRQGGYRNRIHLVQTKSRDKHPAYLETGRLPGGGWSLLNIYYDPETGRRVVVPGKGTNSRVGVPCIDNGLPWLDCQMNYHPVDGCYLTESQKALCRKGPFMFFDSSGYEVICWDYMKGPGLQLPFQQEPTSQLEFDISDVEFVKAKADMATAREVRASREQVDSGRNFLNRPVCKGASAWGPMPIRPILPPGSD